MLRVSAPVDFTPRKLITPVADFMNKWPGVEVRLSMGDRMVDLVNEGFDVAIRIGNRPDSALIARQLAPAEMVLVASPDYISGAGAPGKPTICTQ